MQLKGDVTIHAPRKKVWDFMTDPEQIGQCAPGVEKIEVIEPMKKYRGTVSVGLGSVKACFSGDVDILELEEPIVPGSRHTVLRPEVLQMQSVKCNSAMELTGPHSFIGRQM